MRKICRGFSAYIILLYIFASRAITQSTLVFAHKSLANGNHFGILRKLTRNVKCPDRRQEYSNEIDGKRESVILPPACSLHKPVSWAKSYGCPSERPFEIINQKCFCRALEEGEEGKKLKDFQTLPNEKSFDPRLAAWCIRLVVAYAMRCKCILCRLFVPSALFTSQISRICAYFSAIMT